MSSEYTCNYKFYAYWTYKIY